MSARYEAADIEVLSGLDPVRRRPGMYTDTSRPNHLAHEVIDNSVDEAIAGHCKRIDVKLFADGSLQVADDGRGMPVDKHPIEKIPGVELILTRLHAGGKFSGNNYQYSGGLHGVGVSVVNALSKNLEVWIRRDGSEYNMSFRGGERASKLEKVGTVGKANTGTTLRFWPDPKYFDTDKFADQRAAARAARQGGALPGAAYPLRGREAGAEIRVALRRRAGTVPGRKPAGYRAAASRAVQCSAQGAARGSRVGHRLGRSGWSGDQRVLRQPDSDRAGRHARERFPHRPDRCAARVLRVPQSAAARREAGAR